MTASDQSCVRCGKQAAHMHHRKARAHCSPAELTMPENLIPVCTVCHDWIHAHPADAQAMGYRVFSFGDPRNVPMDVAVGMRVNEAGALVKVEADHDHTANCKVCGIEIKKKMSKPRFQGEARRQRRVITVRVPDDWEDGGAVWDETLEQVKKELVEDGLYEDSERIPNYEAMIAAMRDYVDTRPLVRSYREEG